MATRTWTGGGADNLASTALNWDTAPGAGDSPTFDGAFPVTGNKNCTWDITTGFDILTVNGYTGVVTQTAGLNLTSTTGSFVLNTGTWNSNGQTCDVKSLDMSGSGTKVLTAGASLWYVRGHLNMSGANTTFNYNTGKMYHAATGTVTMQSGVEFYNLSFGNPGGAGQTITFATDVVANNIVDFGDAGAASVTPNGNKIYAKGNVTCTNNNYPQGTVTVEFTAAGNQTLTAAGASGAWGINFIVNKSGGTLTINASVIFGNNAGTNTFTYTAGTVSVSAGTTKFYGTWNLNSGSGVVWSTLQIFDAGLGAKTCTLTGNVSTGVLTLDANMTLSCGSNTITVTGNFTKNGTFTAATSTFVCNGTTTIAGATTFNNFTINNTKTVHLTSTQTFTVSGAFTTSGTSTLDATTGASRANLNVNGSQSVVGVTATDIDSSGGSVKPIHNVGGTNSNTVQWDTTAAVTAIRQMMMMGIG